MLKLCIHKSLRFFVLPICKLVNLRHACFVPIAHHFGDFLICSSWEKRIEDFQNKLNSVGEHMFSSCFSLQMVLVQNWCGASKMQKFWHSHTLLHPNSPLDSYAWRNPWTTCRSFVLHKSLQDCTRQRYMLTHELRNCYL